MKVKIMDYETAKAKVLAREQNPCYANDKTVWSVDKTWAGWGPVRDVYKHISGFRDVEDGYDLPLYLIDNVTDKDVLRYGEVVVDENLVNFAIDGKNYVRIRIFSYNDYIYYIKMVDGEIVDFNRIPFWRE